MAITVDEFAKKLPYELIPTNIEGAFTRRHSPLSGFDPNNASASELKEHGIFVPRPSETDPPELQAAWQRAFAKHWRPEDFIIPKLECGRGITRNKKASVKANSDITSKAWSGVSIAGIWAAVFGTWIVPTVSKPLEAPGVDGGWGSTSWIGIDGAYQSTDVLQTGVHQFVKPDGSAFYEAWYEWWVPPPAGQQAWSTSTLPQGYPYILPTPLNIPVKAGDRVSCYVQYINRIAGGIFFGNETTGQHTGLTLMPPPRSTFSGESAEWIMEDSPGIGEPTISLPHFEDVKFTSAFAFGADGHTIGNPITGDIWTIENHSANQPKKLTSTTLSNEAVTIHFAG